MTQLKCPECGKEFDDTEQACPNCGYPLNDMPPQYETQIKKDSMNDDTSIDWSKVFDINENKFKGTKSITTKYHQYGESYLNSLCDLVGANYPMVRIFHWKTDGSAGFGLYYGELDLIEHLEADDRTYLEEWKNEIDSPCIGLIITIDGKEDCKVQCSENQRGSGAFLINEDLMLKCCNAKTIDFEIFKENDKSVYIAHETTTGKETDNGEDMVKDDWLILNFRALYNYIVDPNMFPEAPRKLQLLEDALEKKQEAEEKEMEKKQQETQETEVKEMKEKKLRGTVWIISMIVGTIMILAGMFSESLGVMMVGLFLFSGVSLCMLLFALVKGKVPENEEVTKELINHLSS